MTVLADQKTLSRQLRAAVLSGYIDADVCSYAADLIDNIEKKQAPRADEFFGKWSNEEIRHLIVTVLNDNKKSHINILTILIRNCGKIVNNDYICHECNISANTLKVVIHKIRSELKKYHAQSIIMSIRSNTCTEKNGYMIVTDEFNQIIDAYNSAHPNITANNRICILKR